MNTRKCRVQNAELRIKKRTVLKMKKWKVTYTFDKESFRVEAVEGKTFTEAYVNLMLRHPGAMITDIKEA
jgi:hypothetical protein